MRKLSLLAVLLLTSCAVGPDYKKPFFSLPERWPWQHAETASSEIRAENLAAAEWWKTFDDPVLTALVEEGMTYNVDLTQAAARVSQARALVTTRTADLFPSVDLQANATRTSNSREAVVVPGFNNNDKPFNNFGMTAVLNYELDLWGRIRRLNESARAQLFAAEASRDAIRLAVASEIAQSYFNLRSIDAQLEITRNTIKGRQEALRFQETQYRIGSANGLTFRQAEAELQAALATEPAIDQARVEQETALAVLLGRTPKDIVDGKIVKNKSIDALPAAPMLPKDLPSTLLERRPDIQSAEQTLIASNAEIGAAKAEYFPRVSLTALIGLSGVDADHVLRSSARRWQTAAGATLPVLDFGRRRALVQTAKANREIALSDYQQTVRVAFKDVLDSLSAQTTSANREKAQAAQVNARSETLRLAQARYDAGYSNYLEVLDAQRLLFQSQIERVVAKRDRLIAAVNLYKAMGGGWTEQEFKKQK